MGGVVREKAFICRFAGWMRRVLGSRRVTEASFRRSVPCKSASEYCPNRPHAETIRYKSSTRLHVEAFLIAMFRYAKAATSFRLESPHGRRSLVYALPCGFLSRPRSFLSFFSLSSKKWLVIPRGCDSVHFGAQSMHAYYICLPSTLLTLGTITTNGSTSCAC
jgi:hypothetical protein